MGKISKDGWLQAFNAMGQFASAMDPNPNGVVARLGQTGAQVTEAELMRRELKKRKEEEKKQRRGAVFSKIGDILGGPVGAVAGGWAGRGKFDAGDLLNSSTMQALGGMQKTMLGTALGGGNSYDGEGWDVLRKRDRYLGPA